MDDGDEADGGCVGRGGVRLREHPRTRACEWRAAPGDDRAAVEAAVGTVYDYTARLRLTFPELRWYDWLRNTYD